MKPIIVHDQVNLGPGRCFRLAVSSMSYRLTRSAITIAILALAVAFLSYMLSYGLMAHDTRFLAAKELHHSKLLAEWMTRISTPDPEPFIAASVLAHRTELIAEYQTWGALSDSELVLIRDGAAAMASFEAYFESVPQTVRAVLIADRPAREVAEELADSAFFASFSSSLISLKVKTPLGTNEALTRFTHDQIPAYFSRIHRIQNGHTTQIAAIAAKTAGKVPTDLFSAMDSSFVNALAIAGLTIPAADRAPLASQAAIEGDVVKLAEALLMADFRGAVARQLSLDGASKVNVLKLIYWITSEQQARWVAQQLKGRSELDAPRIYKAAKFMQRNDRLQKSLGAGQVVERTSLMVPDSTTFWLIVVSFIVCLIGISNTMFMSVTDRFSEIATMKCIGALDGYIMMLFVFEALFQGLVGSAIGIALGFVLAMSRGFLTYGSLLFEAVPWLDIGIISGCAFGCGIFIAALAATGPAWAAARLAPMEAMRVD